MGSYNAETLAATLALVGVVILVAALLSGLVERSGLPQVAVFLALGAVLGPAGLGMLDLTLHSPAVHVVATLSLVLVLFTDAVTLNLAEVRSHSGLATLVLGPGTMLSAALVALAGAVLLGLSPAAAAILGAALASTDPVLVRGLLRRGDVPGAARQALRLESGLNDAVLLPVVLVALGFLRQDVSPDALSWARLGIDLLLLGPGAGVAVGLLGVAALDLVRRRFGVRRDYESLYSLGIAFTAFAAAEAVHGSGFVAVFVAGLTIAAMDVELCDCFLEYGETTAEMALLLTFVVFGASLIWSGLGVLDGLTLLFAVVALLVRPAVFLPSLARSRLDRRGRLLVAWYGPRGLSSLLLVLFPVFAGVPGSERLFAICSLVVLISVALHGGAPVLLLRGPHAHRDAPPGPGDGRAPAAGGDTAARSQPAAPVAGVAAAPSTPPGPSANLSVDGTGLRFSSDTLRSEPQRISTEDDEAWARAPAAPRPPDPGPERISIDEVRQLWRARAPVYVLDARSERTYDGSDLQAGGAIRLRPGSIARQAQALHLPRDAWLVAFCA